MLDNTWRLEPQHKYLIRKNSSVLFFHNDYTIGHQGGVEFILHNERIISCGDLSLEDIPGQWDVLPKQGIKSVQGNKLSTTNSYTLFSKDEIAHTPLGPITNDRMASPKTITYTVTVEPDGEDIILTINFPDAPLTTAKLGFNIEIYPGAVMGKSFHFGDHFGIFPRQFNGSVAIDSQSLAMGQGADFTACPEDHLTHFSISSETGVLKLFDARAGHHHGWFVLRELVENKKNIRWRIKLHTDRTWIQAPKIGVSQAGYKTHWKKIATIENADIPSVQVATLHKLDGAGNKIIEQIAIKPWGKFLRYHYSTVDFSHITDAGCYQLAYDCVKSEPFVINDAAYNEIWRPTLETWFPVQMCHIGVKDGPRVWHGPCHMDDAVQAPANTFHFDGYRSYSNTDTKYQAGTHVNCACGGWHDAGDFDLATGSQVAGSYTLCKLMDDFNLESDHTTVDYKNNIVILHKGDGRPDVIKQIIHGTKFLLATLEAFGHSIHGVIEGRLEQYVHMGESTSMSDNISVFATDRPFLSVYGRDDDRWAFTNRDTAQQYSVARVLAFTFHVVKKYDIKHAEECLAWAEKIWAYEIHNEPLHQKASYVVGDHIFEQIFAACELYFATLGTDYKEFILTNKKEISNRAWRLAPVLGRLISALKDEAFTEDCISNLKQEYESFKNKMQTNPFGVAFAQQVWGQAWALQEMAMTFYQIMKALPDANIIDKECILNVMHYVHGRAPGTTTSIVSGIGSHSLTTAFGTNRADWSYIPGGVASGVALIEPDFPELKEPFPFLWQQAEYVVNGSASYLYCALAARNL